MIAVDVDRLPTAPKRVAFAAADLGWSVWATAADGPPSSVVVRFRRGEQRAYAAWHLDKGTKFKGGAARHVPPGHFSTLRDLKAYLGVGVGGTVADSDQEAGQ